MSRLGASPLPRGNGKILLVEDNDDDREICRLALTRAGYEVLEASDGAQGVQMARHHKPALIFMDVTLPDLDGHAACRMIKTDPLTSSIPIIALTANAFASDRAAAVDAGCDTYLSKPLPLSSIVSAVQALIGPPLHPRLPPMPQGTPT